MLGPKSRVPAAIALVGSILGLLFGTYSTLDYAQHLDRGLHDIHCSVIPGAPPTDEADACRAAMYSPYSALFKDQYWGGVPISLFAIGAFCFFAGFAVYLLVANGRAPRKAVTFFAATSVTPLLVSAVMFTISATKIGAFCQTCTGIYIASILLALGGLLGLATLKGDVPAPLPPRPGTPYHAQVPAYGGSARPDVSFALPLAWLVTLGAFTVLPALIYTGGVPDHRPYLASCGELKQPQEPPGGLIHINSGSQAVTTFEDPLCPTCKAFHDRLVAENIYEKLSIRLALFPLDSTCNWMLTQALHPGACTVARAVICGKERARQVLEWAYAEQEYLTRAGKAGEPTLRAVIKNQWGADMLSCVDSPDSLQALNKHLHYAVDNSVPVSTPQVYLDHKKRFCDEDTDIGLTYTFAQLAPEVLR